MTARAFSPLAALTTVAMLLSATTSKAEFVYRPGEGWSKTGGLFGSSAPVAKTAELQLQLAEDFEKKGDLAAAADAYRRLIKVFSLSDRAASARFRLAQVLEKLGDYEPAFDSYDAYLAKHPDGKDFNAALNGMFQIAKKFMDGEKRRLFGFKLFASNQRAEQMFDTIVKRAPYSKSAAQVLLFRGLVMERQGKDPEAIATYQQVIERFPGDTVADEAQYQIGFIRMRNVREGSYDRVDRVRAQEAFEDFLSRSPSTEKSAQARNNLQALEKGHLKSIIDVAKFYEKSGKIKAAVLYYQDVVRESGSSPEAKFARERIDSLTRQFGTDAVSLRNEPAENANTLASKKRMEAAINTVSRQDYVGPQLKSDTVYRAEKGPNLRLSPSDLEPPLPVPLTDPIVNPAPNESKSEKGPAKN